ncbi:MAG: hypothetical protein J7K46_04470 [Bacteroidales bacterium]|nr:hypothetical protein [Bacteroidales bacterium]
MKTIIYSRKHALLTLVISFSLIPSLFAQRKPITNGEKRMELYQQVLAMKENSSMKDLQWQFLGPINISGRCTDVEVVRPKGKNYTIYVATASGGLWKTINEGTSWEPLFDTQPSTTIGDIALDPSDPNVLWVGTGEANIFRSSQTGAGLFKTTDGGRTWQPAGLTNTFTIARIIVDPHNSNIVYVAASGHEWTPNKDRGVYKTTDGGKTWKKIFYLDALTGAIDLVMDPSDPNTLYTAMWQRIRRKWNDPRIEPGFSHSGIYKTTDGGKNWKAVNKGLPPAKYRGRTGIAIASSNPNVLYAFVDNYEIAHSWPAGTTDAYGRPRGGVIKGATVYRTDNKAKSWTLVSGQTEKMKKYMERHSATYGWVFGQIRVDPNDENTIYTMGLALNISTDGGKTFKRLRVQHGDHHGLWIDPDNSDYLVNVNDGGVFISYDQGKNWRSFQDRLPVSQFFNIAYDMDKPFHVYGSVQDHGSFRGMVDLSRGRDKIPAQRFENAPGGEGSHQAIDPENPNIVYSAGFYGHITRTDLSKSWPDNTKSIYPVVYPGEPPLRGQWLAPFILSPHNPHILYLGLQYIFMSRDRGDTWNRISPDLTLNDQQTLGDIPYHTIFTISESPIKAGLIYAGTDDGLIHVTKDFGKTWTAITEGLAKERWISRVVASKYDIGTVYLTQNGKRDDDFTPYIWKSTDFGKTWKDISGNIPLGPVNVIREDPIDRNILYVGTDGGVFVTKNGGMKWEVLGNLPSTYVHDLIIHPRDNIIVIATHGRGVWALDADKVNGGKKKRRYY